MPKILFVLNESYFFLSHRLPVARAVQKSGAEVHVAAPPDHVWAPPGFSTTELEDQGFVFHPIPLSRRGTNPVADLRTLVALFRLYRRLRPAMIHHLTIKSNIYGGIAARLAGVPKVVFSVTGLGQVFVGKGIGAAVQRVIVSVLLRFSMAHPNCRIIFQNPADRDEFLTRKIVKPSNARVILGSGVDVGRFQPTGVSKTDTPVVVLCARLIWEKGVGEFVEAARTLHQETVAARFALVGDTNPTNSRSVPRETLESWDRENLVEWWGFRQDMEAVLAQCNIVCLPSTYGEGVPKILLEAAASARPIVTTDIPGCRDAIEDGVSGLLVPPGDPDSLADALRTLIADPEKRAKMGAAGRRLAEQKFDDRTTATMTTQVYDELNS